MSDMDQAIDRLFRAAEAKGWAPVPLDKEADRQAAEALAERGLTLSDDHKLLLERVTQFIETSTGKTIEFGWQIGMFSTYHVLDWHKEKENNCYDNPEPEKPSGLTVHEFVRKYLEVAGGEVSPLDGPPSTFELYVHNDGRPGPIYSYETFRFRFTPAFKDWPTLINVCAEGVERGVRFSYDDACDDERDNERRWKRKLEFWRICRDYNRGFESWAEDIEYYEYHIEKHGYRRM